MTETAVRERDDVLADLAAYCHMAARMVCVAPDYADVHEAINECLVELGY